MGGVFPGQAEVVVVGAGLSGLVCAQSLRRAGVEVVVLEREGRVGGRVATDVVQGFRLDHGFQVLLTGYPAARKWLDFDRLKLFRFPPGARLRHPNGWVRLGDPLRRPRDLWHTLTCPVGNWADKIRIAWLRLALWLGWPLQTQGSTAEFLTRWGFSSAFVEGFFRPFFGGVFLERYLATSARKFVWLFHLFSTSEAAVPAMGMGAIAEQLAEGLEDSVWLDTNLEGRQGNLLHTNRGELRARAVVLAGAPQDEAFGSGASRFHSSETHYFASSAWLWGSDLWLGAPDSLINHLAPLLPYSPPGQTLLAASLVGKTATPEAVQAELENWFPGLTLGFLKRFVVSQALPVEETDLRRESRLGQGLFACGDHRSNGSIQGALESGERAAEAVQAYLEDEAVQTRSVK